MRTESAIARVEANKPAAENCIELSVVAESCKWFGGLAKWLSPTKPATFIHFISGEPERSCYAWVEGKNDPPSRALIRMLRSDAGWRVLEYLMRGCKQPWWIDVKTARACWASAKATELHLQGEMEI